MLLANIIQALISYPPEDIITLTRLAWERTGHSASDFAVKLLVNLCRAEAPFRPVVARQRDFERHTPWTSSPLGNAVPVNWHTDKILRKTECPAWQPSPFAGFTRSIFVLDWKGRHFHGLLLSTCRGGAGAPPSPSDVQAGRVRG